MGPGTNVPLVTQLRAAANGRLYVPSARIGHNNQPNENRKNMAYANAHTVIWYRVPSDSPSGCGFLSLLGWDQVARAQGIGVHPPSGRRRRQITD